MTAVTNIAQLPASQQEDVADIMARILGSGDISAMSQADQNNFYLTTCSSLGLNPLTQPFDFIKFQGKTVMYAKKGCSDQLRKIHGVSLQVVDRSQIGDVLLVTTRATLPSGRTDEDVGAVAVGGLRGEALANQTMKAITKSKRRVTLSICGLGMLDESELASMQEGSAETPRQAIARTVAEAKAPPRLTALVELMTPNGNVVSFPKTRAGIGESLKYLKERPELVVLNLAFLDNVSEKLPELSDLVADIRAAAAKALVPDDVAGDGDVEDWSQPVEG